MTEVLRALVLGIWTMLGAQSADAPLLANAIAIAVNDDAAAAPVLGSHAEDAVLLAEIAWAESRVTIVPRPQSWDAKAGVSCGPFQLDCATMPRTIAGQARKALWLLHRGRDVCPASPAAPYLGGCLSGSARRQGDARVKSSRSMLSAWLNPTEE